MRRQALVVGINKYPQLKDKDGLTPKLTTPVRDAEAIARLLEIYGGFEVKRLPFGLDEWQFDPNGLVRQKDLVTAITDLFAAKESIPDTALLFFTGIGLRRTNQSGNFEGFLATSDTKSENSKGKPAWGVSLQWLRGLLKKSPVPQQVVWLVCGHSGELLEFPEDDEDKPGRDRCWIVSSNVEEPLYADADDRSPLVKALIEGLNPKLSKSRDWITSHILKEFIEDRPDENFIVEKNFDKPQRPMVRNSDHPIILTKNGGVPDSIYSYSSSIEITLKQLWNSTANWFSASDVKKDFILEHESQKIAKHFQESQTNADIKYEVDKYKEEIQKALGFTFPEHWWNENSVKNLHESLKHLCGSYFLGQDNPKRSRHISVGAAYLLALMAHRLAWKDMDIQFLTQRVDWQDLSAAKSPLFHRQDVDTAQSSAIALCQLFFHLFQQRDSAETSMVSKAFFQYKGTALNIVFKWPADEPAPRETESLAKKVSALAKNIYTPKPVGNTREAIISLWMNLLISDKGFFSPSSIYMEEDTLRLVAISFINEKEK